MRVTGAVAAAFGAVTACVPASEPAPPAGAFGFVTEPSAASRGEPFVTRDGWTVRIEKVALQVSVSGHALDTSKRDAYGSYEAYRFDASKSIELYARAIPTGPATGGVSLSGTYLNSSSKEDANVEVAGLSPQTSARFQTRSDVSSGSAGYRSYSGPSLLLAVRAVRAERFIAFDLTFDVFSFGSDRAGPVRDVREDALVTVPLTVAAEALFEDEVTLALAFAEFAAADADGDGVVTGAEFSDASCSSGVLDAEVPTSPCLVDRVRERAARLFIAR
jgi:hypothetical protein